jgi:hypothetical protein
VAKQVPRASELPAPVLQALNWMREYTDAAVAAGGGGGGGVTAHSALTGLTVGDDHTQYLNNTRGDARYTQRANNLSDVAAVATARTNLGLSSLATTVPPGTTTTYLRGDATFQTLPLPDLICTSKIADQALAAADTYVATSNINVAGRQQAGTTLRWKIAVTKTAAGTAAPVFTVRVGTAGTIADTARFAFTGVAQTAAADSMLIELEITIRAISVSGSISGAMVVKHKLATTGFANVAQDQLFVSTATGVDTTTSPLQFGVSLNGGAASAWTVTMCAVEAHNLA